MTDLEKGRGGAGAARHGSPEVLAVDVFDRNDVEVEIIEQPGIDRYHRLAGLAGGPVKRLVIGAASTGRAELEGDGLAAPAIGRLTARPLQQPEVLGLVIGPQTSQLGADGAV